MNQARSLIAVVDDDESMCIALRRFLRAADFNAETFPSGAKFLESLQTHQPDCVVLDLNMPDMDGFAVQARLVEMGIGLPVVMITGSDSAESRERALASGASAYLPKTADGQTFLDAIRTAIAHPPESGLRPANKHPG